MKWQLFGLVIVGFSCVQVNAFTTIYDSQDYVPLSFYQSDKSFPTQNEIEKTFEQQKMRIKNTVIKDSHKIDNESSDFSLGKVEEHQITFEHPLPTFFVIGSDSASMRWLEDNKDYLKSLHAIGLFCGKTTREELVTLEKEVHLPLIPAKLDQVSTLIGTNHYPVLVYKGWVTQ